VTDITKIKLARILAGAAFWISIGILFLMSNGLSTAQAYQLISIYYFAVVVLEYPSGVLGDHFSHKTALIAGFTALGIALVALGIGGGFWYIFAWLILAAFGISLVSGSDTALTHRLSSNFKKDQSQIKIYITISLVVATILGPLLYKIYPGLPFIMTGMMNFVAACLVWRIRTRINGSGESNIYRTAATGLIEIRQKPKILGLLVLSALSVAFLVSLKWFYNPLLQSMGIPLQFWGLVMGFALLLPLVGIKLYRLSKKAHIVAAFLLLLVVIVPIGYIQLAAISIGAVYVAYIISGYLDIATDVALNETIQSSSRASILSLGSLISRLAASAYLPLAGLVIEKSTFMHLTVGTAIAMALLAGPFIFLVMQKVPQHQR
jgi:MFS family permease